MLIILGIEIDISLPNSMFKVDRFCTAEGFDILFIIYPLKDNISLAWKGSYFIPTSSNHSPSHRLDPVNRVMTDW